MQTDRRLINAATDAASRSTPIPPRTAAHPEAVVKIRPRFPRMYEESLKDDDISRHPTAPPPIMWQYETPDYVAESSVPSLSLFMLDRVSNLSVAIPATDDEDTQPSMKIVQDQGHKARGSKPVDLTEIDTAPCAAVKIYAGQSPVDSDIADIPTVPPAVAYALEAGAQRIPKPLVSEQETGKVSASWSNEPRRFAVGLNPFDRLRWWLLYPGRLESLLWSSGMLLLVSITIVLAIVTTLSLSALHMSQVSFPHAYASNSAVGTSFCTMGSSGDSAAQKCVVATAASPEGLQIALFHAGPFVAGATVHLQGHGFSPAGRVIITHDAGMPCQPGMVVADQHGDFNVSLTLGNGTAWSPGNHELMVVDTASRHRVMLAFVLYTK